MAASRSAEEKRFSQGPDPGLNRALTGAAGAAAPGRAPRGQGREPLAGHRERPRGGEGGGPAGRAGAEAVCFRLSGHISGRRSGGDLPRLAMQSAPDGAGRGQDQSIPPGETARGVAVWSACPNLAPKFPGGRQGRGCQERAGGGTGTCTCTPAVPAARESDAQQGRRWAPRCRRLSGRDLRAALAASRSRSSSPPLTGRDAATSGAAPAAACAARGPGPGPPSGSATQPPPPPPPRQCGSRGTPRHCSGWGQARAGVRGGGSEGAREPPAPGRAGGPGAPAGSVIARQADAGSRPAGIAAFPPVEISACPSAARRGTRPCRLRAGAADTAGQSGGARGGGLRGSGGPRGTRVGAAVPGTALRLLLPRVRPAGGEQRHLSCPAGKGRGAGGERKQEEQKKVTQTRFKIVAGFHSSLWIKCPQGEGKGRCPARAAAAAALGAPGGRRSPCPSRRLAAPPAPLAPSGWRLARARAGGGGGGARAGGGGAAAARANQSGGRAARAQWAARAAAAGADNAAGPGRRALCRGAGAAWARRVPAPAPPERTHSHARNGPARPAALETQRPPPPRPRRRGAPAVGQPCTLRCGDRESPASGWAWAAAALRAARTACRPRALGSGKRRVRVEGRGGRVGGGGGPRTRLPRCGELREPAQPPAAGADRGGV
ncbi:collagen, type I, alpha 1b-like [Haliaeetus albicilla]|uniref:collagen, type I, alpha 1b-like n=1 Tax=Haliaeetus albicilla TaxID=8969 RepID=UPI0037E8639D